MYCTVPELCFSAFAKRLALDNADATGAAFRFTITFPSTELAVRTDYRLHAAAYTVRSLGGAKFKAMLGARKNHRHAAVEAHLHEQLHQVQDQLLLDVLDWRPELGTRRL